MADSKSQGPGRGLAAHVVRDPQNPPELQLLAGFPGASSEEGHTRLYLEPLLSDYVEIPDDAILHVQHLPPEISPLGGAYLWVRRDAQVIHGKAGGERSKAGFLEGRIAQAYGAVPSSPPFCPPSSQPPQCPSEPKDSGTQEGEKTVDPMSPAPHTLVFQAQAALTVQPTPPITLTHLTLPPPLTTVVP